MGGLEQATKLSAHFNDQAELLQSHRFNRETQVLESNVPPKVIGNYLGEADEVAGKYPLLARTPTPVESYTANPATGEEVTFVSGGEKRV